MSIEDIIYPGFNKSLKELNSLKKLPTVHTRY